MLTKTDLSQIEQIVKSQIKPVRQDVEVLKQDVSGLKQDMQQGFKQVRKDLNVIINFFDHEHLELQDRVRQLELRSGFNL